MEKRRNIKHEIKAIRKLFNNNCDSLSRDEINRMRTNLNKKESIQDFLSTKPSLNDDERRAFKRIPKYLQKLGTDLSLTDSNVRQILYSKSDNMNILHAVDINGVIDELFDTFLKRY